jgi:small subunit ribosomal protein S8
MTFLNLLNDSIVRIRNSQATKKPKLSLRKSNLLLKVLQILRREGYIRGFQVEEKTISLSLKYHQDKGVIKDIRYHSQLNPKTNLSFQELKKIYQKNESNSGLGRMLLSTPFGILTDFECISRRIGGKHLITIL